MSDPTVLNIQDLGADPSLELDLQTEVLDLSLQAGSTDPDALDLPELEIDDVEFETTELITIDVFGPAMRGPAGQSAYQLAVTQGFQGTLDEWLDSLKGGEVSLGVSSTHVRWRRPDLPWQNLISKTALRGPLTEIEVGNVSVGAPGSMPVVTMTGTPDKKAIHFTFPAPARATGGCGDSGYPEDPEDPDIDDIVQDVLDRIGDITDQGKAAEQLAELILETVLNEQQAIETEARQRVEDLRNEARERGENIAEVREEVIAVADDLSAEVFTRTQQIAATMDAVAVAEQTVRAYADDQYAQIQANFTTTAAFNDGLANTLSSALSYTDAFKVEASQTYSTIAAMGDGLASTYEQAKSYTDAFKSQAALTYVTNAVLEANSASTLSTAQSYADNKFASAMNLTYTKAQIDGGLASVLQQAKSYADDIEARSALLFSTKAEMGDVTARVDQIQSAQVTAEGKIALVWGFAFDAGGRINGMMAADDGTRASLDFVFDAVRFWNGSQAKPLMALQDGQSVINGDMVVTGSIKSNSISRIYNAAMGGTLTGFGGGMGTLQTAISYAGSAPYPASVVVILTAAQAFSANSKAWGMEILIDGAIVAGIGGASYSDSPAASGQRNVAAGPYNITVRWRGQDSAVTLQAASITIMEIYK